MFGYRVKNDKSGEPYEKTNTKNISEYLNHLSILFKRFTIEKVIGAKASTQSNQFVLTTRCCKLSSKGIQFGKGKHLLLFRRAYTFNVTVVYTYRQAQHSMVSTDHGKFHKCISEQC